VVGNGLRWCARLGRKISRYHECVQGRLCASSMIGSKQIDRSNTNANNTRQQYTSSEYTLSMIYIPYRCWIRESSTRDTMTCDLEQRTATSTQPNNKSTRNTQQWQPLEHFADRSAFFLGVATSATSVAGTSPTPRPV